MTSPSATFDTRHRTAAPAVGPQPAAASLSVVPSSDGFTVTTTTGVTSICTEAVISTAVSGGVNLIAGSAGKIIRVYQLAIVFANDTTVQFLMGTRVVSGVMTIKAGGSIVFDFSGEPWYGGQAGEAFVLNLGSAVQASGTVYYTQT